MTFRFLHSSDWQLGMTRHFFEPGAQETFSQARFSAIRTLGRIAAEHGCAFMTVCGDVFDSNQVDRRTVARALDALKDFPVPVYLLPGNHDPLNAASVYRSERFLNEKPAHVHVVESPVPVPVTPGVELLGGPWLSKRPAFNPFREALRVPAPPPGVIRIGLAHGGLDALSPDPAAAAVLELAELERAIVDRRFHYVGLGDRHSTLAAGSTGRIWYSGAPEATDFREDGSGSALLVEIEGDEWSYQEIAVGQWRFVQRDRVDLASAEDLELLRQWLDGLAAKERTAVKLYLVGALTLGLREALDRQLEGFRDLFGALLVRTSDLLTVPQTADFQDLGFSGFAAAAVENLRQRVEVGGEEASQARDALMLLLRLAKGGA